MKTQNIASIGTKILVLIWMGLIFMLTIYFQNESDKIILAFLAYTIFLSLILKTKIAINLEFVLLLTFGTVYYFIYITHNVYTEYLYMRLWIGAPLMYFIGNAFISDKTHKYFKWVLLVFAFGLFFYQTANMLDYLIHPTTEAISVTYDFWTGNAIGSPLSGVYFAAIGSLLAYVVFSTWTKHNLLLKIFYFICFLISIYFCILLSRRTFFIIIGLVFLILLPYCIFHNKRSFLKGVLFFILTAILAIVVIRYDWLGVKTAIISTNWYLRIQRTLELSLFSDPRFSVYPLIRDQIYDYTFGGYLMDLGGLTFAHNLWLDILYSTGLYSFFIFVGYTLLTLTTVIRTVLSKHINHDIKILILCLYIGMSLQFMVEPIIEGVPYVFMLFCLINGATYRYLVVKNNIKSIETDLSI